MSKRLSASDIARWIASTERRVQRSGRTIGAVLSRRFDFGINEIWTACTDAQQLRKWFGSVSGELRESGTVKIDVGAPCHVSSKILLCEPRHHLLVTWKYGEVPPDQVDQVELRLNAKDDRTHMELEHRSCAKGDWWFGAGSGWEFALIELQVLLEGGEPFSLSVEEIDQQLGRVWGSAGNA
jgi:uncharacterized protein YndB with AHSA1/START domain